MKLPFLLEIGTEEIPDWMIEPALEQLQSRFLRLAADSGLDPEGVSASATPRRLVVRAKGMETRQPDRVEQVTGPPRAAAASAAQGFARKHGVDVSSLELVSGPKGEYYVCRKQVPGRTASEIMSESLPALILNLDWPKSMFWTVKGGPRFIRPIRWLVVLLGEEVVPVEIAGVRSGRTSFGHRQLSPGRFDLSAADAEPQYLQHGIILDGAARKRRIEEGIAELLAGTDLRVKADAELLHTLAYITEFPTPILGSFDPAYLSLPAEVLVTVMRHHQKYFSVETAEGQLAPHFVAVMNTSADPDGLVVRGNERVLRARFNDARFFWEVDQHRKLADRVENLAHVTFQARLGSYLDKTRRVVELVRELGGNEAAQRAALLAKCDLTTEMVKEFTELQGVVGGLYARAQGESEETAQAIYDQYKPASMEDAIPRSASGQLLSLADKLDTLRGFFRLGVEISGSRDPFALRRAAQGVVRILAEGSLALSLDSMLDSDALRAFFLDRVTYYFRDVRGFRHDEVAAAVAAGWGDLPDLAARLEALRAVRPTGNFEPLAASFKRIKNILRQAGFDSGTVVPGLLDAAEERALHAEMQRVSARVAAQKRTRDYRAALESIASLRPAVDLFFDKVLVNANDERVRHNRLSLLSTLRSEFSSIADFSEIVTT